MQLLILIGHLYLSDMQFGATPRTDTKKTCLKEIGLHAKNHLDSTVNLNARGPYNEPENSPFRSSYILLHKRLHVSMLAFRSLSYVISNFTVKGNQM